MSNIPEPKRCEVCGKGYPLHVIADLGYLGDSGVYDAIPPILSLRAYCSDHDPGYHRVYSVNNEWIGKLGFHQYMHEMEWLT